MTDGADYGRTAGGNGSNQAFVREREQVLDRTAPSGNDDHIYLRMPIESLKGGHDLLAGLRSLDECISSHDPDRRPTPPRVFHDIALGGATRSGNQANRPR